MNKPFSETVAYMKKSEYGRKVQPVIERKTYSPETGLVVDTVWAGTIYAKSRGKILRKMELENAIRVFKPDAVCMEE